MPELFAIVGATKWFYFTWLDKDDVLLAGITDHEYKIYDSAGASKATITTGIVDDGNGVYHFKYAIPDAGPVGKWTIKAKVTVVGDVGKDIFDFRVID